LNALSGDPYHLQYYRAEYEHFHSLFTPEEQAAFAQLKHVMDEAHGIVSAKLTLYYSNGFYSRNGSEPFDAVGQQGIALQ
jgi:hypothetical protein